MLEFLDWRIDEIALGEARTTLPINVESTNQYITHQAALMLLSADYTGGIALSTLFQSAPIIGFHPMESDYGVYMWGAKASIKWLYPSSGDLICTSSVPVENWERIYRRFRDGKRVIETLTIDMHNGDLHVAQAEFTYWAQNSHSLRSNAFDTKRVHPIFDHRYKTSAKLIAGLRALEQEKPEARRAFDDDLSPRAAGTHGVTLARRFCRVIPQLAPMVATRTASIDRLIGRLPEPYNILSVGVGLDTRPWRLDLPQHTWFEMDLPLMLNYRAEILPEADSSSMQIIREPIDLRTDCLGERLLSIDAYDRAKPLLIIWEGGSMYFDALLSKQIFRSISNLMSDARALLWFDFVSEAGVKGETGNAAATNFIRCMRKMGEPFISGHDDIAGFLAQFGLLVKVLEGPANYTTQMDPIFQHYSFCTAAANWAEAGHGRGGAAP